MLSKEDFYDRAKDFALFKDVDGKYFTFDEYKTVIKDNQTDKEGNLIYLYANNKVLIYRGCKGQGIFCALDEWSAGYSNGEHA